MASILFHPIVAVHPQTGELVRNASGQVYAESDTSFSSPLAITDVLGTPVPNVAIGPNALTEAFRIDAALLADSPSKSVVWKSGDSVLTIWSPQGLADRAEEAATAAQEAANSNGGTPTRSGARPVGQGEIVFDAAEYGIGASNGAEDDSAKWAEVLADMPAGAVLKLAEGTTTRLDQTVSITDKSILVRGYGARILQGANVPVLAVSGTYGAPVAVSSIAATSRAETGSTAGTTHVLTMGSAVPWTVGSLIKIVSDDIIAEARPGSGTGAAELASRHGEFAVVREISGSTVTLSGRLRGVYTTNVRAALVPETTFELRGVRFDTTTPNGAWTSGLISLKRLVRPRVQDVTIDAAPAYALGLASCYGYEVDNVRIRFARNNPTGGQYGYGIVDNASNFGVVSRSFVEYVRHGWTDDTVRITPDNADLTHYGRTYGAKIVDSHAVGTSGTAWDTHHAGEGHTFDNCSATGSHSAQGFTMRGRNHRLISPKVDSCRGGIAVIEEADGGRSFGITVSNPDVRNCEETALKVVLAPTGHPDAGTRRTDVALTVSGQAVVRETPRALDVLNATVVVNGLDAKAPAVQPAAFPELVLNTNSVIRGERWRLDVTGNTMNEPTPVRTTPGAATPCEYELDGFEVVASDDSATRVVDTFSGPNSIILKLRRGVLSHRFAGQILGSYDLAKSWVEFLIRATDATSCYLFKQTVAFGGTGVLPELASIADPIIYCQASLSGASVNLGTLTAGRRRGQMLIISITATGTITIANSSTNKTMTASGAQEVITGAGAQVVFVWDGSNWRELGAARHGTDFVMLRSPDGTKYQIKVANGGAISATAV